MSWKVTPRRGATALSVLTICAASHVVRADPLADTVADFSVAAQGTNGFQYGVYTGANATMETGTAAFSTENFTIVNGNPGWGGESLGTPAHTATVEHPASR